MVVTTECHLNGVVGRYEFFMPRDFCTFSGNDYGCSPDWPIGVFVCVCVCVCVWGGVRF